MTDLQKLFDAVLNGDAKTAAAVTHEAIADNVPPMDLIQKYMIPAMDEVGKRFECEDYFVPELLLSARAMKAALEPLRPLLAAAGAEPVGRVVIGTVKGDLHDIGKNLVASMLEGGGFEVTDLGTDVSAEKFIDAIQTRNANIVCLSALLTVTMPSMRTIIDAIKAAGVRDKVKIMVGGAPVTEQFAREIGADAFGENAGTAVQIARKLTASGIAA
jgi:5-methyltetrahydrofolate--homocysteine methyltransferase